MNDKTVTATQAPVTAPPTVRASDVFLKRKKINDAMAWMPVRQGVEFQIAFVGNEKYQKAYAKILKSGEKDKEKMEDLHSEAIAKHILVGVKGLAEFGNRESERYSLIRDYVEVATMVMNFARDPANFVGCNNDPDTEELAEPPVDIQVGN